MPVYHVKMAGVPGSLIVARYRGLAGLGGPSGRRVGQFGKAGRPPAGRARTQLVRGMLFHKLPA